LEIRAHAHPALLTALKKLKNYQDFVEKYSPTTKRSGLFFFSSDALARPEVVRYRNRLHRHHCPPRGARILLLVPQTRNKPFHKAREFQKINEVLKRLDKQLSNAVHVCFYAAPFGVIPLELDEVYPLSQHEVALPIDKETVDYVGKQVADYIKQSHYEAVVLLHDPQHWDNTVRRACRKATLAGGMKFEQVDLKAEATKDILTRLEMILRNNLSE
jgi:7-cyano-7-deazaguanine tRNA-ribosyltransferase